MTDADLGADGLPQPEGKRPWRTPQIIVSVLASRTREANPTTTPFVDVHKGTGVTGES